MTAITATILIDQRIAVVQPAFGDVLTPMLSYHEVDFSEAGCRLMHQAVRKQVFSRELGDRLSVPVGCVQRVQKELQRLGHTVRVVDLRRSGGHQLSINQRYQAEAESAFPGLTAAVSSASLGTILANPSVRGQVIGTIARLYSKARIFVACATRHQTRELAAKLGHFVGGSVDTVCGWNWRSGYRVVVGTFTSLDRSQPSDWPIVIFADAKQAIRRATHEARSQYGNSRIYAIAEPHRPRSQKADLLVEVLAGPVIYTAPSACYIPPAMDVMFARYGAPEAPIYGESRQKRQQLWQHPQRNRAIAAVAQAVCGHDHYALARHGILLDGHSDSPTLPASPSPIIVVESPEQAKQISQLLEGWPIYSGGAVERSDAKWGLPPRSIATTVHAEKHRYIGANVVIVAAGGQLPQIPSAFTKRRGQVLLVDFADEFNAAALQDTKDRLAVYQKIGCIVHEAAWLASSPEAITSPAGRNPERRRKRRKRITSRRLSRPRT